MRPNTRSATFAGRVVTEETTPAEFSGDDEASASYALYAYLSYLEEEMVEALSGR